MKTKQTHRMKRNSKEIFVLMLVAICFNSCLGIERNVDYNSWLVIFREAKTAIQVCRREILNSIPFLPCLERSSLQLFDKMTANDIIPLTDRISLVKQVDEKYEKSNSNILNPEKRSFSEEDDYQPGWASYILSRSLDILSTHYLQMDLMNKAETGRARHRRNQILPILVFGMTALGMMIVPIGFQLLAVLGGKALLLSKMALLLASINGLRRVATSGIQYGLYQSDSFQHVPYDRSELHINRPRHMDNFQS